MRSATLKPGDRVRLSARALAMGLAGRLNRRTGVVTGRCKTIAHCVTVRRDGETRAGPWACWLWRRASDGALGRPPVDARWGNVAKSRHETAA